MTITKRIRQVKDIVQARQDLQSQQSIEIRIQYLDVHLVVIWSLLKRKIPQRDRVVKRCPPKSRRAITLVRPDISSDL